MTSERVIAGGDFDGARARLRARWDRESFLVHLTHGDTREGTVHRRHFVEVAPSVVTHLVERFSGAVEPQDLVVGTAVDVVAEDVQGFVDALFDPGRSIPYVFVTPASRGGKPILDPDELARALVSIAEVHVLNDPDLSWAVRDALLARGATKQHSCFVGGVRLYRTGFTARAPLHDHPLMLRRWFEGFSEDQRVARVTERVARHLADDVDLHARGPSGSIGSTVRRRRQPHRPPPRRRRLSGRPRRIRRSTRFGTGSPRSKRRSPASTSCSVRRTRSAARPRRVRTAERALEQAVQERDSAVEDAQSAFRLGTVLDAVEAAVACIRRGGRNRPLALRVPPEALDDLRARWRDLIAEILGTAALPDSGKVVVRWSVHRYRDIGGVIRQEARSFPGCRLARP